MSLVFLCFVLFSAVVLGAKECPIRLDSNIRTSKIFTDIFSWQEPKYSPVSKIEKLPSSTIVNVECGTGFVRDNFVDKSYVFQCTDGVFNRTYPYEELLCRSNYHKHSIAVQISSVQIRSKIFKCDGKDWKAYQIKTVKDNSSKITYVACLDTKVMRPKFVFQPSRDEKPPRSLTLEERSDVWGFDGYGKSVNDKLHISKGYVENSQKNRTTNLFSPKYSARNKYPYYFNRGHLVPYADFADADERKTTCQYINAAPQWEVFNKNQWSLVEREARLMRQSNTSNWEVYTGTFGNIPTPKGPLFLAPVFESRKFKKGLLPVPMLYWKLVYNAVDKTQSKAFIGVNNPELKSPDEIVKKYRMCTPLPIKKNVLFEGSEFLGFTYQCKVDEFLKSLNAEENIVKETFVF